MFKEDLVDVLQNQMEGKRSDWNTIEADGI